MSERDIVERLRDQSQAASDYCDSCKCDKDKADAASEITRLRDDRRWIPVAEGLPEEGKSVLVSTTRGEVEVAGYETFANGNIWWTMSSGDPVWVTHWMPLPAPPSGGEVE